MDTQNAENTEHAVIDAHVLEELGVEMRSDRAVDRMQAAVTLGRLGTGPAAMEALKHIVSEDPDDTVRTQARYAYEWLKSRVERHLIGEMKVVRSDNGACDIKRLTFYLRHPNSIYRVEAVLEATRVQDKAALPVICERMEVEHDEWVVASMARAVGLLGDPSYIRYLEPLMAHVSQPRVLANTLEAVGLLDSARAAAMAKPYLEHADPRVRAAAAHGVYGRDRAEAMGVFRGMLDSGECAAIAAAVHGLMQVGDQQGDEWLRQVQARQAESRDGTLRARIGVYLRGKQQIVQE